MIETNERLIVALDVPTAEQARALVQTLGDGVVFYKVGLELCMSGDYFELVDWLVHRGKKVFADLKFYDVPATVSRAVRQLQGRGITYLTVHGDRSIMEAAAEAKDDMGILAVTVLTSLDREDLREMGCTLEVAELVTARAKAAQQSGCDGVIASGHEARMIREACGTELIIVTPGIRPSTVQDDQKRVVTPAQADPAGRRSHRGRAAN